MCRSTSWIILNTLLISAGAFCIASEPLAARNVAWELKKLDRPTPLLTAHPKYCEPITMKSRWEGPAIVDDPNGTLEVRGWRFSYNVRGMIESPNRLNAKETAVIVVHPWAMDDGVALKTPEPAGVAFAGWKERNELVHEQIAEVINPLLKRLRREVGLVMYSLPGTEDADRKLMYRSYTNQPTAESREQGTKQLLSKLAQWDYTAQPSPKTISLSGSSAVADYFRQIPGIDATDHYNRAGFWNLPMPVAKNFEVDLRDVVIYDGLGYSALRDFLKKEGIRHVLLCGFHADMCVCSTTAGYKNLKQDFNVFLVGDATQATFPASDSPRAPTAAAIGMASMEIMITQTSWIETKGAKR